MKGVFCYKSKKGIVFLAKGDYQSLFSVGDTIVSCSGQDHGLVDILKNTEEARLEDELKSSYAGDKTELFLGRYKKRRFQLSRLRLGQHYVDKTIEDFDYISDSENTISSRLQKEFDSGFDFSCYRDIEDMLHLVYNLSRDKKKNHQFGFIDRYGAKTLFSPDIVFSLTPTEYKKRGELNQNLFAVNAEFYGLLTRNLELTTKYRNKQSGFNYKTSFLQHLRKKKVEKEIDHLGETTGDIIDRYLDYHHGLVERFTIKTFIKDKRFEQRKKAIPKIYNKNRQWTLQQRLDKEFMPRGTRSAIISLRKINNYSKRIQEAAYHLEKELGLEVRPLINFPYLSVKGSEQEIRKLYSLVKDKKFGKFSRKGLALLSSTKDIAYSHGFYIPEIIADFVDNRRGSRIVPIKVKHKGILWNLINIGSDKANSTTTGAGISVAVCDTGVDYNHSGLGSRFGSNKGYDFIDNNNDPMDLHYHGTHVAGTIAGMTTGVASGCTLYAVRVLNEDGCGSLDGILQGVDWCITNQVDIANFSLGSATDSPLEYDIFKQAYNKGLVSVAAAGNNRFGPSYPASYDCVIAVAAVDRDNNHADFSNVYYTNNVSAPGVDIYSTLPDNQHGKLNGTSMATPHISGCGALVGSMQNGIDKDLFQNIIEETCLKLGNIDDPDYWATFGCGLVQADKAVEYKGARWMKRLIA